MPLMEWQRSRNRWGKGKQNVRRVDSADPNGDAQYEEFELEASRFAPLGKAQNVRWVDADNEEIVA